MDFGADERVRHVKTLMEALFKHVLHDEEPLFISDEASALDVSLAPPDELLRRFAAYYKTTPSIDDLRRPLVELLPILERHRLAQD